MYIDIYTNIYIYMSTSLISGSYIADQLAQGEVHKDLMFICNVYTHINIHTYIYIHIYMHVYLPYCWVLDCWPTCATTHLFRSHLSIEHDSFKRAEHELICSSIFINYHVSPSFPVPHISLVITTWRIQTCGTRTHFCSIIHQLQREPIFCSLAWLTC